MQLPIATTPGDTSAVTARGSSRATLVAIAQPEREQGTDSAQAHEHAYDGMTAAPKTLCFPGFLES
jgi:hypothetical protein